MSTYVFKAIDLAGGKARGEVEAESKQAVSDQRVDRLEMKSLGRAALGGDRQGAARG